ncbi:MAG: hydroxyacylglutathione hydrolase [Pseudomonadota bacterium]
MQYKHGIITVVQLPALEDNYAFLLRDEEIGTVAAVDTPDAATIAAELDARDWTLDLILNTHWHPDHTGGNEALKARYGAHIIGPRGEQDRIPGIDQTVTGGEEVHVGRCKATVLDTPGHTAGHIAFHFADQSVAFVGDTLFSLGCGRLFEGTPPQMWQSLLTLRDLPPHTTIYCAHEYSAANAAFALSLEPENKALQKRAQEIEHLTAKNKPTVPVTLADEIAINPFLRGDDPNLAASLNLEGAAAEDVFTEVRRQKDSF